MDKYPGVMEITVRWNPDSSNKKSLTSSCTSLCTQPFLEFGNLSPEEMADLVFRETYRRIQEARKKGKHVVEKLDELRMRVTIDQGSKIYNYGIATKLYVLIKRIRNRLRKKEQ